MTNQIITALFGLIGALVGAGATVAGQRISAKHQTKQAELARRDGERERCHQAIVKFLAQVDLLLDSVRELRRLLGDPKLRDSAEHYHSQYAANWAAVVGSRAELRLVATPPVLDVAGRLLGALGSVSGSTDLWYRNQRAPSGDNAWQPAYDHAEAAREKFVEAAKSALGDAGRDL